jgi:hypothetical protein
MRYSKSQKAQMASIEVSSVASGMNQMSQHLTSKEDLAVDLIFHDAH